MKADVTVMQVDRDRAADILDAVAQDTPSIAASEGDWIEWKGGECPVDPGTLVEPQYAADADPAKGTRIDWPVPAARLAWNHDGEDDDIIAYRIVRTALQEQSK